ncbi:MAG: TlpA disulfide reductase family protein [Odoribacter sp.]
MFKIKLFLFLCLCISIEAIAGPGKVIVKGAKEPCCIYNSERARERRCFMPEKEQKGCVILLPEEQTKDLFYLIVGAKTSWIRVQADETIVVNVSKTPWKFSNDEQEVNAYLFDWTQKMYFGKENLLLQTVEQMFSQIPRDSRVFSDPAIFFTPEYLVWVKELLPNALADLEKEKLVDENFVKEQKERIKYAWWELQLLNYQRGKINTSIPFSAMEFIKTVDFDNEQLLHYPGFDYLMRIFFAANDDYNLLKYDHKNFLYQQAMRITNPLIREAYVLNELEYIITRGKYVYQTDEVLKSTEELVTTGEGKEQYVALKKEYQKQKEAGFAGKQIYSFEFENKDGKIIRSSDFFGKYLFIDIWATWCAPCKCQIPFLKKLEEELEGRDIEFLSVSVDKLADKNKWLATLKELGMNGNCAISPNAFNYEMFKLYKVTSIPRFILVDPEGRIVFDKGRRPSDPILKMQLKELLDKYEKSKTVISGDMPEFNGKTATLMLPGGMYKILGSQTLKDGRFEINTNLTEPAFLTFAVNKQSICLWVEPKNRIDLKWKEKFIIDGDNATVNNLLLFLNNKYAIPQKAKLQRLPLDKKRGSLYVETYRAMIKEVEQSQLSQKEKKLLIGYFQGDLLNKMFGLISSSKVFGKSFPKPDVKKGYATPVLSLDLQPEIVNYNNWLDGVQEFLYAQLDAGKVKIKSSATRLVDISAVLSPEIREEYLMEALRTEVLRSHLVGIRDRIETSRPFIKKLKNIEELNRMPQQIVKGEQRYKTAFPGTDLSAFSFKNEKDEIVTLSDFKGKYIFIDLWSTGCNPCIGEIPYIKEMEHHFIGKPIVWVSISLDLHNEEWKNFLIKQKMDGIQLLCEKGFKHPFIQQIGLSGIPRFMLLDKTGKVIDYSTIRPSNPILEKELNILLK